MVTKVEIYVCGVCGKQSKVESKIVDCEASHVKEQAVRDTRKGATDNIRNTATSVQDVVDKINKYCLDMLDYNLGLSIREPHRLRYSECSNSHSAPIGMKTNWSQREAALPTTYPGYGFSIQYNYEYGKKYDAARHFAEQFIRFGTGGPSGQGATLWPQDFPTMYELIIGELEATRKFNNNLEEQRVLFKKERDENTEVITLSQEIASLNAQINELERTKSQVERKCYTVVDTIYNKHQGVVNGNIPETPLTGKVPHTEINTRQEW